MKTYRCQSPLIIGISLWLTACSGSALVTLSPTIIANRSPVPIDSASKTPAPRLILSTATPSLTPIFIQSTVSATPTPQPTLTADKAKALVWSLLQNNGDCHMPCFWGLTPGQTHSHSLDNFMGKFGNTFTPDSFVEHGDAIVSNEALVVMHRENGVYIRVYFYYYLNQTSTQVEQIVMHADSLFEKGKDPNWKSSTELSMLYGDASFARVFQYYTLPQILQVYGQPSQVLVMTFRDAPDDYPNMYHAFSLVLLYEDQGFFVEYSTQRKTSGNFFVGCPNQSYVHVNVWDSQSKLSLTDIVQRGGDVIGESNLSYFKPINQATGMTLDQFYETFKDAKNMGCVQTPIEVWPQP